MPESTQPTTMEELQEENDALRAALEDLQNEIEKLKDAIK